ncbi:Cytochrome b-c1 complex subunit 9 protein [Dioscorea alata]|uniref:Cytochrome b-c1 complex subunit 9 protein n=1 Tax=Dioscorea alata TaxID=55571 RepID=A0ACB7VSA3_DIOAL|nr:Cytochrome b-c1 complex subunit 9 protein [Dioscorea alata]
MDHYQTLGLNRSANREEIKEAFRKSALKFHPDKHSHSSDDARNEASLRFKRASEAYQVLIDERKRADYDLRLRSAGFPRWSGKGPQSSSSSSSSSSSGYYRPPRAPASEFDPGIVFRWLMRRRTLIELAVAGALLGAYIVMEDSLEKVWKRNNAGKSFEETIESIKGGKSHKDSSK